MIVTYQSKNYTPEVVTGRYVRVASRYDLPEGMTSRKPNYMFKVMEAATCKQKGQFFDKPGMGYTLREYVTNGEELPQELKDRCIKSKTTKKWD